MDRRKRYLKVLAFAPAVAAVTVFVGCRTGAFSKPEPKPEPVVAPPVTEGKPPVYFNSTKTINYSGAIIGLTPAGTPAPNANTSGLPAQPTPPAP